MVKKLVLFLSIMVVISSVLVGCSSLSKKFELDPIKRKQNLIEDYKKKGTSLGVKLYGKYEENVPGNYVEKEDQIKELEAKLEAENVNIRKAVAQADLTGYYKYSSYPYKHEPYVMEESSDFRIMTFATIDEVPLQIVLSYGIEKRDGAYDKITNEPYYENYFPEPLIGVEFFVANTKTEGNKLLYTSDGELVGKIGGDILYGMQDNYKGYDLYYLKEALRIMGKD